MQQGLEHIAGFDASTMRFRSNTMELYFATEDFDAFMQLLREIGKKDFLYNEKARILAHEMSESGNKTQAWIGKAALKELETLVKVEGRIRLISTNTRMGGF